MIWLLRKISIHLWLCVLFCVPAVFGMLVVLNPIFPELHPGVLALTVFGVVLFSSGALMHLAAGKMVSRLIKEGQTWERSGLLAKAKKSYQRAIRLYDTFLFWPLADRRAAVLICGAIARFQVNDTQDHPGFYLAFTVYLKLHPEDEDIALSWLDRLRTRSHISSLEQEVLTLLARQHGEHTIIREPLADIFLWLERKDFIARKLYRQVAAASDKTGGFEARIEELVGRSVETIGEKESPIFPEKIHVQKKIRVNDLLTKIIQIMKTTVLKIRTLAEAAFRFTSQSASWLFNFIRKSPKAGTYLKYTILLLACAWLIFFMVNTLSHLFKPRTIEEGKEASAEIQVPKPFTIQVAAYLKQKHAHQYLDILKRKDVDAHVKKVAGGGKTWYLVRVSEFADKRTAAEFGSQLKDKGIIDDFFVSNK